MGPKSNRANARDRLCVIGRFAILPLVLTGCVGNPYIANPRPGDYPEKQAARDAGYAQGSMQFAVRYLDNTYEAYGTKVSQEWDRQQSLAAAFLGLGGLIIGDAASKANA